ncbi:MAG: hypothetical protein KF784_11380 [Fimbriimonadaceae bacterium]|nr:hypothetical protein [Fimbriimonadaceae bacterium]
MRNITTVIAAGLAVLVCGCNSNSGAGGTQDYARDERPFAVMEAANLPEGKWTEFGSSSCSIKLPKDWKSFDLNQSDIEAVLVEAETSNPAFKGMALSLLDAKEHGGLQLFALDPKDVDGFSDNMSIVMLDAPANVKMDDAIKIGKEEILSIASGTIEYAEVQPPAGKFARIEYTSMRKGRGGEDVKLASWAYLGLHNGKMVTITFSAIYSRAAEMEKIADSAITSFKMK